MGDLGPQPPTRHAEIAALCADLDDEPMLHLSLHSKELFHSNILGWLFEKFPDEAVVVLEGLVQRRAEWVQPVAVRREYRYLDLVVELPGFAPTVIENKVFSLPDVDQLRRYADSALAGLDDPTLILLSFTSPGWADDKFTVGSRVWRWLSYDDLAERVQLAASAIRASRAGEAAFAADLLEHYARFVRIMRQLATAVGEPLADEGVELDVVVTEHLRRIRLHDALSKARARTLVNVLRRQLGDEINGRPVTWKSDFTRGNVLIEAFVPTADGDRVGWQLQGGQWRLAVISGSHAGRTEELRAARHTYVADRYGTWFDFAPVTEVVGPAAVPRAELAGDFNRYDPDFVYRYRPVPRLTVAQLRELARQYQARASTWPS